MDFPQHEIIPMNGTHLYQVATGIAHLAQPHMAQPHMDQRQGRERPRGAARRSERDGEVVIQRAAEGNHMSIHYPGHAMLVT